MNEAPLVLLVYGFSLNKISVLAVAPATSSASAVAAAATVMMHAELSSAAAEFRGRLIH